MSLLMQALKKAELAKKNGPSEGDGLSVTPPAPGLSLDVPEVTALAAKVEPAIPSARPAVDFPSLFALDEEAPPRVATEPKPVLSDVPKEVRQEPGIAPQAARSLSLEDAPLAFDERTEPTLEMQPYATTPESAPPPAPVSAPVSAPPPAPLSISLAPAEPPPDARPMAPKISPEQTEKAKEKKNKVAAQQEKAKAIFSAKLPKARRKSFILMAAVLTLLCVAGGSAYVYMAMNPSTVNGIMGNQQVNLPSNVPRTAVIKPVADASTVKTPEADKSLGSQTTAAMDKLQKLITPTEEKDSKSSKENSTPPAAMAPEPRRAARASTSNQPDSHGVQFRQSTRSDPIMSVLENAFRAFNSGDTVAAERFYQQALKQDANNRDAMLGLAAVSIGHKQFGAAATQYLKLLELDPNDPDAIAGLTSMRQSDPLQGMSRLKNILAQNPDSGPVLFVLGNMYAQETRWADAQQAYFRAFSTAPANADYAFNLAVSLDRLDQPKLALDYYQRALAADANRAGNFNSAAVRQRVQQLQAAQER